MPAKSTSRAPAQNQAKPGMPGSGFHATTSQPGEPVMSMSTAKVRAWPGAVPG